MAFEIASRCGTCSTLVWSTWSTRNHRKYNNYNNKNEWTLKSIVLGLRDDILISENPATRGTDLYRSYGDHRQPGAQVLDGYEVKHFALMIGTVDDEQTSLLESLEEFGFKIVSDFTYNGKNSTDVALFMMPIDQMLARLEEFDQHGELKPKVKDAKAA